MTVLICILRFHLTLQAIDNIIYNLNTEGGAYITVDDGEYLTISGGNLYKLDKVPEIRPKPLQNCWYGEKHVDIASICEYFEDSSVWWSKVYYGNEYRFENDEFIDSIEIIGDDLSYEIQEESQVLDKYFFDGLLYLH